MKLYREEGGELVEVSLENGIYHAVFVSSDNEEQPVPEEPNDPEPEISEIPEEPPVEEPDKEPEEEPEEPEPEPEIPEEPPVREPEEPPEIEDSEESPEPIIREIDHENMIVFKDWLGSGRYERFQKLRILKNDTETVEFYKRRSGGAHVSFNDEQYTLYIDGVRHTTSSVGNSTGNFTVDTTSLSDGWHVLDILTGAGETTVPYAFFVLRSDSLPEQKWMPVCSGSHDLSGLFQLHWVPAKFDPIVNPLPRREYPEFSNKRSQTSMYVEMVTGTNSGSGCRRPNLSKEGIWNTFNRQSYFRSDLVAEVPKIAMTDGPRGVGSIGMVTHITIGTAKVEDKEGSPALDNLYVCDPLRLCRVSPEGHITTLFGYRDKGNIPRYWETKDKDDLELVGDWSGVPEELRNPKELWGFAWAPYSLKIDHRASPIPEEDNRQPHVTGPVGFVASSGNGVIYKIEFNPTRHGIPPKVTVFYKGDDTWDCVAWGDHLLVSERGAHRVVQLNIFTGEVERVVVSGADYSSVSWSRTITRKTSLENIRNEDVVGPEGLYVIDDWLYYGSAAMGQVKRVHLVNGEVEVVVNHRNGSSPEIFFKIAVSDGTFGPKGTVFVADWKGGLVKPYPPEGSWSAFSPATISRGKGDGGRTTRGYSAAVACSNGRFARGSSGEGIQMYSAALPGDEVLDKTRWNSGRLKWSELGYLFTHDYTAQSLYGLPLPWGEDEDIDYYLETLGHKKP